MAKKDESLRGENEAGEGSAHMAAPPASIKLLSTFPEYCVVVTPQKRTMRETTDGRLVEVVTQKEQTVKFHNHRAECDAETFCKLSNHQQTPWYGVDFIAVKELKALLLDKSRQREGHGFLAQMHRRSVIRGNPEAPISPIEMSQQVLAEV